jgi:hypothetical protein
MIPDPGPSSAPGEGTVSDLLDWRPDHGVLSLYVRFDPGNRSPRWPAEVRNGLSGVLQSGREARDHEAQQALEATVERVQRDLLGDQRTPSEAAGLIGFLEVGRKTGEERWYPVQVPPRRTEILYGHVAQVNPLLEVLDDGAPLGVAVISSERVRLLDWRLGSAEEIHDWELEYFGEDWRELKAQRPRDPARGNAVSAAGRDQYNLRLESNRTRFAEQTGELARAEQGKHGWRQLLAFGDERYAGRFANGFAEACDLRHAESADLISESTAQIARRVAHTVPELNRDRERSLIERVKEAAYAEGRSALGVQATLEALQQGRVEHLVYDATRDLSAAGPEPTGEAGTSGDLPLIERMIELALSTGAAITPVEGESAELLDEQGGVISLLRY